MPPHKVEASQNRCSAKPLTHKFILVISSFHGGITNITMNKRIISLPFAVFNRLFAFDEKLALAVKQKGCPFCGGPLHWGNYERSLYEFSGEKFIRHSLCCGKCRRRVRPPAVRFLGRKRFSAYTVVIASLQSGQLGYNLALHLQQKFNIDRRTLKRWRKWWQETFAKTLFWHSRRGRFSGQIATNKIPESLFTRFALESLAGLERLLRFFADFNAARVIFCLNN